jgi:L-fuculose-phosphate aldolase
MGRKEHDGDCREVARFMRRLYRMGLTTTSGGNLSRRLADGGFLLTPSASDKGRMRGGEIGVLAADGEPLAPSGFRPSIESRMHLAVYRTRPDVGAVVHAHPLTASAFAATRAEIDTGLIAEARAILGRIAYVPYFPMGSAELAEAVGAAAAGADCLVMRNHGALTVGRDLLQAFDRLEVLESAARMTLLVRQHLRDEATPLSPAALAQIDRFMGRA